MVVRGIRGAINVEQNSFTAIIDSTRELLHQMIDANDIQKENVAAIFFTVTPDLNAAFPAEAARQMGWISVPLMCSVEIGVPGALAYCIRILILVNTEKSQKDINHIYLKKARTLREDIRKNNT